MLLDLKMFLLKRNVSQHKLAQMLGVTETTVSLIMRKKRKASFKMMQKFKELFELQTMDEVLKLFERECHDHK